MLQDQPEIAPVDKSQPGARFDLAISFVEDRVSFG
jgi:hypothetical protein